MKIEKHITKNWETWYGKESAEIYKKDIEARYRQSIKKWNLTGMKIIGSGYFAFVISNDQVVLKILPTGNIDDYHHYEYKALQQTTCTPKVIDISDDGLTILMEKINNSISLQNLNIPCEQKASILGNACKLFRNQEHINPGDFIPLQQIFDDSSCYLTEHLKEKLQQTKDKLSDNELILIHNDLHQNNVLIQNNKIYLIDPKPCLAPKHAEVFGIHSMLQQKILTSSHNKSQIIQYIKIISEQYVKTAELDLTEFYLWLYIIAIEYSLTQLNFSNKSPHLKKNINFKLECIENIIL